MKGQVNLYLITGCFPTGQIPECWQQSRCLWLDSVLEILPKIMHWRTPGTLMDEYNAFSINVWCNVAVSAIKIKKRGRQNGLSSVRDEDVGRFVGVAFLRSFLSDIQWVLGKHEFVFHFSVLCVCRVWGVCADHLQLIDQPVNDEGHYLGKEHLLGPYLMFNPACENALHLFCNFLVLVVFFHPFSPKIISQLGQIAVQSFLDDVPVAFFPGGGVRFGTGRCKCSPCVCLGGSNSWAALVNGEWNH